MSLCVGHDEKKMMLCGDHISSLFCRGVTGNSGPPERRILLWFPPPLFLFLTYIILLETLWAPSRCGSLAGISTTFHPRSNGTALMEKNRSQVTACRFTLLESEFLSLILLFL